MTQKGLFSLPSFRLNFEGLYRSQCCWVDRLGQHGVLSYFLRRLRRSLPRGLALPSTLS